MYPLVILPQRHGLPADQLRQRGQLVKVPQPHLALIVQLVTLLLLLGLHPEQPLQAGQLAEAQRLLSVLA